MTVSPGSDPASLWPDWSRSEFVFLEAGTCWSSAVTAEFVCLTQTAASLEGSQPGNQRDVGFVSLPRSRQIVARLRTTAVLGIIVVLDDAEREALVLLGRLARLGQPAPPVLMVGNHRHGGLVPVLYEAGASSVLIDRPNDIQVAAWCEDVVRTTGQYGGHGNAQDV